MDEAGTHSPRVVAIVSATDPYPPDTGKKIVMAGLVEYWQQRVGRQNVHYILVAPSETTGGPFQVPVRHVFSPTFREQFVAVACRTAAQRHALQESVLYSRRIRRELAGILTRIDADVEIFDTVRLGQYAPELPRRRNERRIIYLDDLFSRRYARMRSAMRNGSGPRVDALGEFSAFVPRLLRPVARTMLVQAALLRAEEGLVARREIEAARGFSACLLVSAAESAHLSKLAGTDNVYTLPPFVQSSGSPLPRRLNRPSQFVFLGRMTLPHNHDAMMAFLEHQMDGLIARIPDVIVRIVGGGVRPELSSVASRFGPHLAIDGYVADLNRVLSESCAMLSPLRFGSGVKVKVLEALARGVPVVATSIGAEGIASGPEWGVLVEDDLDRHVELLQQLTDPDYNERISRAAGAHFAGTYSRDAVFRRYDEIFGF